MPTITTDYRGKILRYLGLSITEKPEIDILCDRVESTSELLAQQVLDIIIALDNNASQIATASEGMIKLDVIEWKEERKCDLYHYKKLLKKDLANAIGYKLPVMLPW